MEKKTVIADSAPAVEHVYNISDEHKQLQTLRNHFNRIYEIVVDHKYIPEARYEKTGELTRYLSGLPTVNFNAVMGWVKDSEDYERRIVEQLQFRKDTVFLVCR